MLVLSRKKFEKIVMPELGITIAVIGIGCGKVKIGIEASEEIKIFREEVLQLNQKAEVETSSI